MNLNQTYWKIHEENQLWKTHAGLWEVAVIPENKPALTFWRKTISNFTGEDYQEVIKTVDYDTHQPKRVIFCFDSSVHRDNESLESKEGYQIRFVKKMAQYTLLVVLSTK